MLAYDTNNYLVPIFSTILVGAECYDYFRSVFSACKDINGFDVEGRVTIVDQEK